MRRYGYPCPTCNFDNGVIRGTRPVTFLTRAEADGFSLRLVPRAGAPLTQSPMAQRPMAQSPTTQSPMAQAAPPPLPPPPPMRGGYTEQRVWPPQEPVPPATAAGFHTPGEYAALRAYEAQELAIRRGDPMWQLAYGRAAMASDSGLGLRNETSWYHGGDRMIATDLDAKFSFMPGMAFVGDAKWTNVHGVNTRLASGNLANTSDNIVTGAAGFAFELGRDSELKLQALAGNDLIGGGLKFYSGAPDSFAFVNVNYHQPYVATPTAVNFRSRHRQCHHRLYPDADAGRVGKPGGPLHPLWRAWRCRCRPHRRLGWEPALGRTGLGRAARRHFL